MVGITLARLITPAVSPNASKARAWVPSHPN
ncbi:Uncharacterised protein [Vibrio cholerae]|nr:Uncharacterised protein [Vibrio cholerae]CSI73165.1 Uncharacterised protein [Vibrio cholerae]